MFIINFPMFWSFFFFSQFLYIFFIFFIIVYLLPIVKDINLFYRFKKASTFSYITGFDVYWLLLTPLVLIGTLSFSWASPLITVWFGHIIISAFQIKMSFLIIVTFATLLAMYCTSFYFSSREVFDYILTCFNLFIWIFLIFFSNSLFSVVFFFEILSTIIFLLLVSSTFSSTYYYNNLNLTLHNYFHTTTPFYYLQTLVFFFWVSLLASINLFFFFTLFYLHFLTLDWHLFESIFLFNSMFFDAKNLFLVMFIWANLLFCIFLKCGLVPFYAWKPGFFKGLPLHALLFYIIFFYFFLFLFFIVFFLIHMNEIFYFFIFINIVFLLAGLLTLIFILCEAYYLKVFFAMSSILNTLFIFLALTGGRSVDTLLFL